MRHSAEVLNDKLTEIMGAKVNTELGGPTTLHKVQPIEWSCRY